MTREPQELIEIRRVLGAQLAAHRQAAGLTQGQLAKVTFRDRSTVAHIEIGRSRANEQFWRIADERCGAGGALLAGFRAWAAAKQDHEVRARETQLAQARAKAESLRATAAPIPLHVADIPEVSVGEADQVTEQLVRLLCGLVGAMNRRELLQLLGWTVGAVVTSPAVHNLDIGEQERLARAIVSPNRVDVQVIDHIDAMLRHCQRQEDALGSRAVLSTALGQRHLVQELLAECPASLRPRLLSTYSNMSTSIGYYFFELNDSESAKHYLEQARAAAHDAGNVELAVYALCEWSYIASWRGETPAGLDLAAAAQKLVSKSGDPLVRVGAAQRAATAYAFDGRRKECLVELESARNDLASAGQVSAESPVYFYNEGYLVSHESECLLRLGRPQEAVESANSGLTLYDKSFVDGYAVCALHLGNAHLQSGEIDEAARALGDAAGLAAQTRSARLVTELHATRARMQPWQDTRAVSTLDDRMAHCGLRSG
ncbi:MAG TPA: helix-turn-helix transcriptional regulator [Pseudonocardiaceae bacterium]|jgi:tetratricopeptide (TPR) repeat protein/transcriptional regulator with XRE-family HTH domain